MIAGLTGAESPESVSAAGAQPGPLVSRRGGARAQEARHALGAALRPHEGRSTLPHARVGARLPLYGQRQRRGKHGRQQEYNQHPAPPLPQPPPVKQGQVRTKAARIKGMPREAK